MSITLSLDYTAFSLYAWNNHFQKYVAIASSSSNNNINMNPVVDVLYLEADEIEKLKNNILNSRFGKLQTLRKKIYFIYSS